MPADGNEQPAEIGQGLVLLALATTDVNSSLGRSARATSSIALLWSWKFETPGLNDFPFIKAVFPSKNATWIRGIAGDRCGCTASNRVRA